MFNLSGSEIVVILLLALVVLGPEKLPEAIRRFGRVYSELRRMSKGFQDEFKEAFDEPLKELRETAQMTSDAVRSVIDSADEPPPDEQSPPEASPPAVGDVEADDPPASGGSST